MRRPNGSDDHSVSEVATKWHKGTEEMVKWFAEDSMYNNNNVWTHKPQRRSYYSLSHAIDFAFQVTNESMMSMEVKEYLARVLFAAQANVEGRRIRLDTMTRKK